MGNFATDYKRSRAYFTSFLRGNLKEDPAARRGKRLCGPYFCSSTGVIGSSSSLELYIGKRDPSWVYLLHRTELCLILNAWCSVSTRSSFSPDLICSLSMWNLPQQLTKSTWFAPEIIVYHAGVVSPALANEAWDEENAPSSLWKLWSWVLSLDLELHFLCFLMWL